MTDQRSAPAGRSGPRTVDRDAVAFVALCVVFAVLDIAGVAYVISRNLGQQLTIMISIGGLAVLAMFVGIVYYVATNPMSGRPSRPGRRRPA